MSTELITIPNETIISKIYFIRGKKVMFDKDLAELYQVPTMRLNEQVKRNLDRFPPDFMFTLTKEEFENLISHFAISSWGGTRKPPRAFTEQGVAMLSSVLKSAKAVQVNIQIIRTFSKLREILTNNKKLTEKMDQMERKYDKYIYQIFTAIKQLREDNKRMPEEEKRRDRWDLEGNRKSATYFR